MTQPVVVWNDGAPVKEGGEAGDVEIPAVPGETVDHELNRKVLARMGECAQAIDVDIDDI